MDRDFLEMLKVYSCGLFGASTDKKVSISKKACSYAVEQGILPLFYAGIEKLKNADKIIIADDVYQNIKYITIQSVIRNEQRVDFVHKVLNEFVESGIDYCVLKGESLSALYEDKSCRISGDTDILINKNDLDKVSCILKEKGFELEPLFPTSHHLVGKHPLGGVLECHFQLYDEHISESFFGRYANKTEVFCQLDSDCGQIRTLGVNDGFRFVFFHYVKHLLSEGVGIRQLVDVLMYSKFYKHKIDWNAFFNMLNELNFAKLFDTMLTVGVQYLGFSNSDLPQFERDDILAEELLCDMQNGGVFGFNEIERKNFEYLVLEMKHQYKRNNFKTVIHIVFPKKSTLEKRYIYLKKCTLLYPVAWCHRMFDVIVLRRGKASIKEVLDPASTIVKTDLVNERLDMMKRLNIL